MPIAEQNPILLAKERTSFDLAKMKRYFGEPVLLGDERIEDFNEYALAMASSLEPADAAAHALTYQYILESHWYMRLVRYRGHLARYNNLSVEKAAEVAKKAQTSAAEAKSLLAMQEAFEKNEKFDFLVSQVLKRMASILAQIAMHRISLAEALERRFQIEERNIELEYKKMMLRKEDELQALVDEKQQQRMQREREEKQRLRNKLSGKRTESGANSTNHQRSQGADKSGSQ